MELFHFFRFFIVGAEDALSVDLSLRPAGGLGAWQA